MTLRSWLPEYPYRAILRSTHENDVEALTVGWCIMTFDEQVTEQKDIHEKLMRMIDEGASDEALELLFSPDYDSNRLTILVNIVHEVAVALARDRDLALARALARALVLDLDLAFAFALDRALDRALAFALDRALALARALARALDRALAHRLSILQSYSRFIVIALGRIIGRTLITFAGVETLTVPFLSNQLTPYLQALVDLQEIISTLKREAFTEPEIISIVRGSTITDITGVGDAVRAVLDIIIPWRREHAKRLAVLEEARREAEDREIRARAAKTRAEAKKIEAEEEKTRAEAEHLRMETTKMAFDVITMFASGDLPPEARDEIANRLLHPIGLLATSPLELSAGESPKETPSGPKE
jgi:hypothetical protein